MWSIDQVKAALEALWVVNKFGTVGATFTVPNVVKFLNELEKNRGNL